MCHKMQKLPSQTCLVLCELQSGADDPNIKYKNIFRKSPFIKLSRVVGLSRRLRPTTGPAPQPDTPCWLVLLDVNHAESIGSPNRLSDVTSCLSAGAGTTTAPLKNDGNESRGCWEPKWQLGRWGLRLRPFTSHHWPTDESIINTNVYTTDWFCHRSKTQFVPSFLWQKLLGDVALDSTSLSSKHVVISNTVWIFPHTSQSWNSCNT